MLYWSHYCKYPPWRHVKTLMTLQTLLTRHFRQCSCVAGICIWNDGGRTKCQNVVFYRALLPSCPHKKCSGTIQRTSVWQETITHFLLNIFIPSACTAWAGRGWDGLGGYHALCFMTSGQAGHRPAPPSHFISIPRVIIYTTESLSILSTLYLQSYYLHYLLADFQSRMTRWWWPRHSSAVCTNEIAIFLITVQLRCKHRVQDSRNNTRYPEISIIHSQWSS